MTTVAIHQPSFFPWMGYFDKIQNCDYFVFLDDVQYTRGTFMNKMNLRGKDGWGIQVICPVHYKYPDKIKDVTIAADNRWYKKIEKTLRYNYSEDSVYFNKMLNLVYNAEKNFSRYNIANIIEICRILAIQPRKGFVIQSELGKFTTHKTELIIDIVNCLGGDVYCSGTGGLNYLNVEYMTDCGIDVIFQKNLHFLPWSVVDLLLVYGIGGILNRGWLR